MATFEYGDISLTVDEDGFMEEPDKWNEDVAAALATLFEPSGNCDSCGKCWEDCPRFVVTPVEVEENE